MVRFYTSVNWMATTWMFLSDNAHMVCMKNVERSLFGSYELYRHSGFATKVARQNSRDCRLVLRLSVEIFLMD
jgi:hypothetical protein